MVSGHGSSVNDFTFKKTTPPPASRVDCRWSLHSVSPAVFCSCFELKVAPVFSEKEWPAEKLNVGIRQ